jgi:hypothetical protein
MKLLTPIICGFRRKKLFNVTFEFYKGTRLSTIFGMRKSDATDSNTFARILSIHHLHFPNASTCTWTSEQRLVINFFSGVDKYSIYVDSTPLSPLRNDDDSHDVGMLASSFKLVPFFSSKKISAIPHTTLP